MVYHLGATTVEDEDVAPVENTACVENAAGKGMEKGKGNTVGENFILEIKYYSKSWTCRHNCSISKPSPPYAIGQSGVHWVDYLHTYC